MEMHSELQFSLNVLHTTAVNYIHLTYHSNCKCLMFSTLNLDNLNLDNSDFDYPNFSIVGTPFSVSSQLADGPTRRRIKSSRDVGELVVNPIQLIRS